MHGVPSILWAAARRNERSICFVVAGVSVLIQLLGCGIGRNVTSASDAATGTVLAEDTTRAREILTEAINKLSKRSSDWRVILNDALYKIPDVKDVKMSVSEVLGTATAATETEFRCNADFLRLHVREELITIRAGLLGTRPDPLDPVLCGVDPVAVDVSVVSSIVNRVSFYGYDFQKADVAVFLVAGVITSDVSRFLHKPSNYLMTLDLGSGGLRFTPASQRLVLRLNDMDVSSVSVLQPTTTVCPTRVVIHVPSPTVFAPPKVGGGDDEFAGGGPKVRVDVHVFAFDSIRSQIVMLADEVRGDGTEAYGDEWDDLYTPPQGWTVDRLLSADSDAFMYIDADLSDDVFARGGDGPVDKYVFVGAAEGNDIGKTRVTVFWAPVRLVEMEAGNCVSPSVVRSLERSNAVSPGRRSALAAELASIDPAILNAPVRPSPFSR